jgi:hypothetical protein
MLRNTKAKEKMKGSMVANFFEIGHDNKTIIEGAMLVVPSLQCCNTLSSLHALFVCSFFAFCVNFWSIFQSCFAFCGTTLSIFQFFLIVVIACKLHR